MYVRALLQLIWTTVTNAASRHNFEGMIELREVKEVRLGKSSKEFDRLVDELRSVDDGMCFVVLYGSQFKLHTLSVIGESHMTHDLQLRRNI